MNYIKVNQSGNVYPYQLWQLREDFPNVSFPQPYEVLGAGLADFGVYPVTEVPAPSFNRATQKLVELTPTEVNGAWTQQWSVEPLTPQEAQAVAQTIQAEIVDATQKRLDDFARTRNYDGILSAATYASSTVPKFQAEGQYAVQVRDATWSALYQILAEVQAGTRPMPTGYADIEPLLPTLSWPV